MAKVISIAHGKNRFDCLFSGTLGNKVYCIKNGIQYTRSRPVCASKPRTTAQLDHNAKFTAIMKFLQPLTVFLRVGFKCQTAHMSAFNAAMSYNLMNAIAGTNPEYTIDYSKVLVSMDTLPEALNPTAVSYSADEITFTWDDNRNAMANDRVVLVVYNPAKQLATIDGGNTRVKGIQIITLPADFSGDEVQCYIAFQNAGRSIVSDSRFIGKI